MTAFQNPYRARAEKGEVQLGTWVNMIRTPSVLTLLKAAGIAATPGIDAMTIGPTDPAQNLGVLGTPKQKDVLTAHRQRLVEAARKHGKQVAMITDTVDGVREMIALGATLINYSSDAGVLRAGFESVAKEIRR